MECDLVLRYNVYVIEIFWGMRNKMKKSFIRLLILLLAVPMLFGQLNSISGTIRNSITLEPLPYANLVIKGTYLGGTSNVDGYFYLSGLSHD